MSNMIIRPMFDEMVTLREAVNSLFENSFIPNNSGVLSRNGRNSFGMNVYEDAGNFYVVATLPGINPDQIDLSVKENTLTLSGEYNYGNWPTTSNNGENGEKPAFRTLLNELPQGKFYRQVSLSAPFEFEKIEARYEGGILKLTLPKAERSQSRKIQVQVAQ